MAPKPPNSSMNTACRLLILAYPAEFRAEYGTEMARVFRDRYWNMRAQRGIGGVLAFWFDALTDVLATVPREHAEVLWRDLQCAFRMLQQQAAARSAIAVLALGIGATGLVYGAVFPTFVQKHEAAGRVQEAILSLLPSVTFWLWFACAHLVSALLVEAMSRQKEISVTAALGPGRRSVVRQLLTESVLLSMLGGLGGFLLACVGTKALVTIGPDILPHLKNVAINPVVLVFTLVSAFLQRKYVKNLLAETRDRYRGLLALGHNACLHQKPANVECL